MEDLSYMQLHFNKKSSYSVTIGTMLRASIYIISRKWETQRSEHSLEIGSAD